MYNYVCLGVIVCDSVFDCMCVIVATSGYDLCVSVYVSVLHCVYLYV